MSKLRCGRCAPPVARVSPDGDGCRRQNGVCCRPAAFCRAIFKPHELHYSVDIRPRTRRYIPKKHEQRAFPRPDFFARNSINHFFKFGRRAFRFRFGIEEFSYQPYIVRNMFKSFVMDKETLYAQRFQSLGYAGVGNIRHDYDIGLKRHDFLVVEIENTPYFRLAASFQRIVAVSGVRQQTTPRTGGIYGLSSGR